MKQWCEKGVNFSDHLYVPEVHPVTGHTFCEMEDEGHVFKVRLHLSSLQVHTCPSHDGSLTEDGK